MGKKCGGEMEKAKWKTFNTAGMQDLITNVYVQPELLTTANIHENSLIDQIIISVFKKWECVLPLLPPVLFLFPLHVKITKVGGRVQLAHGNALVLFFHLFGCIGS